MVDISQQDASKKIFVTTGILVFDFELLYMTALTACRFNPVIRSFADRLRENGKAYKVILTACMQNY